MGIFHIRHSLLKINRFRGGGQRIPADLHYPLLLSPSFPPPPSPHQDLPKTFEQQLFADNEETS